jgi:hypothetical protein
MFGQNSDGPVFPAMVSMQEQMVAQEFAREINFGRLSVEDAYIYFWSYVEDKKLWDLVGMEDDDCRSLLPEWKVTVGLINRMIPEDKRKELSDVLTNSYKKAKQVLGRKRYNPFESDYDYYKKINHLEFSNPMGYVYLGLGYGLSSVMYAGAWLNHARHKMVESFYVMLSKSKRPSWRAAAAEYLGSNSYVYHPLDDISRELRKSNNIFEEEHSPVIGDRFFAWATGTVRHFDYERILKGLMNDEDMYVRCCAETALENIERFDRSVEKREKEKRAYSESYGERIKRRMPGRPNEKIFDDIEYDPAEDLKEERRRFMQEGGKKKTGYGWEESNEMRAHEIIMMGREDYDKEIGRLVKGLDDPDPRVVCSSLSVLGIVNHFHPKMIDLLDTKDYDLDFNVVYESLEALARMRMYHPKVLEMFNHELIGIPCQAAKVLGRSKHYDPKIFDLFKIKEYNIWDEATDILWELWRYDPKLVEMLKMDYDAMTRARDILVEMAHPAILHDIKRIYGFPRKGQVKYTIHEIHERLKPKGHFVPEYLKGAA